MATLSAKTNTENVVNSFSEFTRNMQLFNLQLKAKSVKFVANEKNGKLAPVASAILDWAVANGYEMTSKPLGKSSVNKETVDGSVQEVTSQLTTYTLK